MAHMLFVLIIIDMMLIMFLEGKFESKIDRHGLEGIGPNENIK